MLDLESLSELAEPSPNKIVLFVVDGLGGLPDPTTSRTELEAANLPNLDGLARESALGLIDPVGYGITPGSGPGHLALFGYDPIKYTIGRGVLEALGIGFALRDGDVAARANFCTMDAGGVITDRRAGRIPSEESAQLCTKLRNIKLAGAQVFVEPSREHRFVVVFRGDGLSEHVTESDPSHEGHPPKTILARSPQAQGTAAIANEFVAQAQHILADSHPANMVLLRGFSQHPSLPHMPDLFKLHAAAIAVYPMYRGLAKLVGMDVLETGTSLDDELETMEHHYGSYDYFYLHFKRADTAGEDGDFAAKVRALEEADAIIPRLTALKPEVLIVTGDHSTPAALKGHSWHPVPLLFRAPFSLPDDSTAFTERACLRGSMGRLPATAIMPLALAHAQRLTKYGA